MADFAKAIQIDLNMGKAYGERGKLETVQKKYDLAIADLSKAVLLSASSEEIYMMRALCYSVQNKNEEAIADYSTVINLYKSKDAEVFRVRGDLFTKQENYSAAIKDYSKALSLKKDDVAVLLSRGNCYYVQGKTKFMLAELDFKKVLEIAPKNAIAARSLGKVYFDQEKWQAAVDNFTLAISNGATSEDYLFRGKSYYKLNKKKECCSDLNKAGELGFTGIEKEKQLAGCQ